MERLNSSVPCGGCGVELLRLKMRAIVICLSMAFRCSAPELSKQMKGSDLVGCNF